MTRSAPEPAPPEVSFEHGGLWTTIRFSVHQSLIHGGYFCGGRDDINWRRWNFPSPKSPLCLLRKCGNTISDDEDRTHNVRFWSRPLYHAATAAVRSHRTYPIGWLVQLTLRWSYSVGYWRRFEIYHIRQTWEHYSHR